MQRWFRNLHMRFEAGPVSGVPLRPAVVRVPVSAGALVLSSVLLLSAGLTGCVPVSPEKPMLMTPSFASDRAINEGLAALARGDYQTAEDAFNRALTARPKNAVASLAQGIVYDQTGRPGMARVVWQEAASVRPEEEAPPMLWGPEGRASAQELARRALARQNAGGPGAYAGLPEPGQPGMGQPGMGQPGMGQPLSLSAGAPGGAPAASARPAAISPVADINRGRRFQTLKALEQANLITPDEYSRRRSANIGALLPMTHAAPGEGLDRPPPTTSEEVDRLDQLARAYETRNIDGEQHAAERQAILDALLPENPRQRALPPPPPANVFEASDRINRLEEWRASQLISNDEFARERAALQRGVGEEPVVSAPLSPPPAKAPAKPAKSSKSSKSEKKKEEAKAPARKAGTESAENPAAVLKSGRTSQATVPYQPEAPAAAAHQGEAAVFLATLHSRDGASREWESLKSRFPELQNLQPRITTLTMPEKGTIYRLNAGPLPNAEAAKALCEKLKGRQYCEETNLGG